MECLRIVLQKIIVEKYKKYSLFGFRFGPEIFIKIQISKHKCGKFSVEIIEGKPLNNFEIIFAESIEKAKSDMIKELILLIRRKNILRDAHKKHKLDNSTKGSFDELTTRMRKNRENRDHPCALETSNVIVDEKDLDYVNYFGETSKISVRQTKI